MSCKSVDIAGALIIGAIIFILAHTSVVSAVTCITVLVVFFLGNLVCYVYKFADRIGQLEQNIVKKKNAIHELLKK
jgi:hypothetical protein